MMYYVQSHAGWRDNYKTCLRTHKVETEQIKRDEFGCIDKVLFESRWRKVIADQFGRKIRVKSEFFPIIYIPE